MSVPPLMDHIRVILWSFKNKWELMWKIFFLTVAVVFSILGKTSLPCFPELSWAGVQAFSISGCGCCDCSTPASREPLSLVPDVRPLLPPAHFPSQGKKNLFQRTCWEWRLLSSVNSFTLLHAVVHLLLIIYIWDHMGCPENRGISTWTLPAPSQALGFGIRAFLELAAFILGICRGRRL